MHPRPSDDEVEAFLEWVEPVAQKIEAERRCGPWTERGDGTSVCEKCGEISGPYGCGPFGI